MKALAGSGGFAFDYRLHQHRLNESLQEQAMSQVRQPAVYILASSRHGTLYTGVTADLIRRTWLHRQYQTHLLVWFERHTTMPAAITREKQIKKWYRAWKVRLIEETNPAWMDLWPQLAEEESGSL